MNGAGVFTGPVTSRIDYAWLPRLGNGFLEQCVDFTHLGILMIGEKIHADFADCVHVAFLIGC